MASTARPIRIKINDILVDSLLEGLGLAFRRRPDLALLSPAAVPREAVHVLMMLVHREPSCGRGYNHSARGARMAVPTEPSRQRTLADVISFK